jgi:hypothetical protein
MRTDFGGVGKDEMWEVTQLRCKDSAVVFGANASGPEPKALHSKQLNILNPVPATPYKIFQHDFQDHQ